MNYKVFNIAIPIRDNNVVLVDGIAQHDTANVINVRLMDGVDPFDFTGYTEIYIIIMKPDGTHVNACVTDDPNVSNDNNPYRIQVIDPVKGRISFTLQGQATILTGSHFGQILIMGAGHRLTSAKFNYYVGDSVASDADPGDVVSSNDYISLKQMMARLSLIATEERVRVDSEMLRALAEIERERRSAELENDITEYLKNAEEYVELTETYKEQARRFAQLAQEPSAEIMADLVASLDLASESYVNDLVESATNGFDAGLFTELYKLLQVRRGLKAELPTLQEGELGWATDSEVLYVGGSDGPVPINGVYVASASEPERHDILWIDLSAGSSVKYYDGTAWRPTATATFA